MAKDPNEIGALFLVVPDTGKNAGRKRVSGDWPDIGPNGVSVDLIPFTFKRGDTEFLGIRIVKIADIEPR